MHNVYDKGGRGGDGSGEAGARVYGMDIRGVLFGSSRLSEGVIHHLVSVSFMVFLNVGISDVYLII